MRRVVGAALAAGLGGALASCRPRVPDAGPAEPLEAAVAEAAAANTPDAARDGLLSARCHPTDRGVSLEKETGDDFDLGDGIAAGDDRYAVGLVHRTPAGRTAAVVLLDAEATAARVVDLGRTLGDAPPPQLAACDGRLLAAALRLPDRFSVALTPAVAAAIADPTRQDLALYAVDSPDPAKPVASVPQHRDDSLAFDLACAAGSGLVVWDEVIAATPRDAARGVIRAARFQVSPAVRADPVLDVSPPDSDAEMPRVVAGGHGFFVLWIAHRAEATGDAAADPAPIEATGEVRSHGWLEMVAVDPSGHVAGPVRRLTPASGHVGAYDVQSRVEVGKTMVLAVARDDGESVDGSGGTLWRLRVRDATMDPPLELPTDGLGRGAPTFVDSPPRWLSWVGPREQLRLLPLDANGDVASAPSIEDSLDDTRLLFSIRPPKSASEAPRDGALFEPSSEARLLASAPADTRRELRVFGCRP
ncbi:MAG TPA: hypothetical protein VGM06_26065 [Polyangiaceae bacterium]|jgi:hypothetical protein